MLIDFNFRHFQPSDDLIHYISDRIHRLEKFDRKPQRAQVVFSFQKRAKRVDVTLTGARLKVHAKAESEDFFACIDEVAEKLHRQLEKKKPNRKAIR